MHVLTINELLRLTRKELCDLAAHFTASLSSYPEGSPERATALINRRNVRWALAQRNFSPG